MSKEVYKLFLQKVSEGEASRWAQKRKPYAKYKKRFQVYRGRLLTLAHTKLAKSDYEKFEKLLEKLELSIYDLGVIEQEYYFREGIKVMRELSK